MSRRATRTAALALLLLCTGATVALASEVPNAPANVSGGGGAGGGVEVPGGVVEFELGIDGDRFGTAAPRVEVTVHVDIDGSRCDYQTSTEAPGTAEFVDTGAQVRVTLVGPVASGEPGCVDLDGAELGVDYAGRTLLVTSTPQLADDGRLCRRLLRENPGGTARVRVERAGDVLDGVGRVGSGGYSREELLCPAR